MPAVPASAALVRRELLTTLRSKRSFGVLVGFVGIAAIYAVSVWPDSADFGRGFGAFDHAGLVSRELVRTFSYGLLAACLLLVPTYAAGAIVLERERSTYDFLSVSLVRPAGIVFAKMWNALGFFLILFVALAPVLGLAFFLVGIDPVEFGYAMLYILITSFSACSVGLFCSARFRKSFVAIGASYLGILTMLVGPMIVTFIGFAVVNAWTPIRGFQNYLDDVAMVTSPPGVLLGVFSGQLDDFWFFVACLLQFAIALLGIVGTMRILARPFSPPKIEHRKPIDDDAELNRRRKQFPYYLIDPLKRKKSVEDGRNPMLVREMRWGFFSRGSVFVRVFYSAFALYFFIGLLASADARSYATMNSWLVAQMVITILGAPALMANALTKEYELGNIDMLRMTLMNPKEILLGKLFSGATALVPALVAATLSCVPVLLMGGGRYLILAMGYGSLLVCAALSLSLGLVASLLVRRTISSLVLSYILSFFVFFGCYAIEMFIRTSVSETPHRFTTAFFSPLLAFSHATDSGGGYASTVSPDLAYWFASSATSLGICSLIIAGCITVFSRRRMQDR